jgi:hypothetical protein
MKQDPANRDGISHPSELTNEQVVHRIWRPVRGVAPLPNVATWVAPVWPEPAELPGGWR